MSHPTDKERLKYALGIMSDESELQDLNRESGQLFAPPSETAHSDVAGSFADQFPGDLGVNSPPVDFHQPRDQFHSMKQGIQRLSDENSTTLSLYKLEQTDE